jgi:hypothetical protein
MRSWRARASVAVAVAAVLLSLLAAGEGGRARKPKCTSDTACGAGKVCLVTGLCGLPNSASACSATRPCSAAAPSDTKRCKVIRMDANGECGTGLSCVRNTGLGYNTCMCPGDTKWFEGGPFTGVCGLGPIGGPGAPGVPLPSGCGCEDGKFLKSPGSSECVAEADCTTDEGARNVKPNTVCGANEEWYDVKPCPAKCRAADPQLFCSMMVQSGCGCTSGLASLVGGKLVCKARKECDANAV